MYGIGILIVFGLVFLVVVGLLGTLAEKGIKTVKEKKEQISNGIWNAVGVVFCVIMALGLLIIVARSCNFQGGTPDVDGVKSVD